METPSSLWVAQSEGELDNRLASYMMNLLHNRLASYMMNLLQITFYGKRDRNLACNENLS